ncbi:MAG: DUF983 domain-containing protein [Anaerolineae bacterium]|nr:DUF983 domain-containing protein [Phycisphaerae bacterium]
MSDPKKLNPWLFIWRALRLRCPECGVSPMFKPWRLTRSLYDWFNPLDGCPRCGYAYRREPGYFMMAICALNYGLVCAPAIATAYLVESIWSPPMWMHVAFILAPMPFMSFLLARHAKSLFVAFDHYCDPHVKAPPGTDTTDVVTASPVHSH